MLHRAIAVLLMAAGQQEETTWCWGRGPDAGPAKGENFSMGDGRWAIVDAPMVDVSMTRNPAAGSSILRESTSLHVPNPCRFYRPDPPLSSGAVSTKDQRGCGSGKAALGRLEGDIGLMHASFAPSRRWWPCKKLTLGYRAERRRIREMLLSCNQIKIRATRFIAIFSP